MTRVWPPERLTAFRPGTILSVSLYVLESAAALAGIALYKKGGRPVSMFLSSPAGAVMIMAVLIIVTSAAGILVALRKRPSPRGRWFVRHLALSLLGMVVMLASAELAARALTVNTPDGEMIGHTLLIPRSWAQVSASGRAVLVRAATKGSYLIFDDQLGWAPGRSRRSDNGLYLSSVEGIRSRSVGVSFGRFPAKRRIAIVGDSFTFGLEVRYEDTWGYKLEQELSPDFQVLNFGVDGYGVDQAYLRYRRDVRPWHPDVVVFGLIDDDFRRTMGVYGFLTFTMGLPFPKPRFIVRDHRLVQINSPLPTPSSVFETRSVRELPFVDYDGSFRDVDWQWHCFFHSYPLRFLLSNYRRWTPQPPEVSDQAMRAVNGELLRSFRMLARAEGTIPIVLWFPSKGHFEVERKARGVAREVLESNGIPYRDMTDCVSTVTDVERYLVRHYSPRTNETIARCLRDSFVSSGGS